MIKKSEIENKKNQKPESNKKTNVENKLKETSPEKDKKPNPSKQKIILFASEEIDEDLEDFIENIPEMRGRRRAPTPFLDSKPIVNLESGLAEVPTTKKEESTDTAPGYALKSGYSNINLYSNNGSSENKSKDIYTPGASLGKVDVTMGNNNTNNLDFQRWQQSNVESGPKQQENYKAAPMERFEVDNSQPWQKKKDHWSL